MLSLLLILCLPASFCSVNLLLFLSVVSLVGMVSPLTATSTLFPLGFYSSLFWLCPCLYPDCWGLWFCIPGRCVPCPLLGPTPLILCLSSFPLSMSHLFCWSWLLGLLQISGLRILCVRYSGQKSVAEVTSIWTAVQGSRTRQNWKGCLGPV